MFGKLTYARLMLLMITFLCAMFIFIIYYGGWSELVTKLYEAYPKNELFLLLRGIYIKLFIGFLLVSILGITEALLLSHKIAGPLVRIKRYLDMISQGDLTLRLRLPRDDELRPVSGLINDITERLGSRVYECKKSSERLSTVLSNLKQDLFKSRQLEATVAEDIEFFAKELSILTKHLSYFKVLEGL